MKTQEIQPAAPFQDVAFEDPLVSRDVESSDPWFPPPLVLDDSDRTHLALIQVFNDDFGYRLLQCEGPIGPEKESGEKQHTEHGSPKEDEKEIAEALQRRGNGGGFLAEVPHNEQD